MSSIDLTDEECKLLIDALEHRAAYARVPSRRAASLDPIAALRCD